MRLYLLSFQRNVYSTCPNVSASYSLFSHKCALQLHCFTNLIHRFLETCTSKTHLESTLSQRDCIDQTGLRQICYLNGVTTLGGQILQFIFGPMGTQCLGHLPTYKTLTRQLLRFLEKLCMGIQDLEQGHL